MNRARRAEARLGRTIFASPEFRASVPEIENNLNNPAKTDVTVRFIKAGKNEIVMVMDKQSSRILNFDLARARPLDQIVSFVRQIVQAVSDAH